MIDRDLQEANEAPTTLPKYRRIADKLRNKIESAVYPIGVKLPSDFELSREFDSSRLTVIRALRQLEVEGLVERRAGSGTYVGSSVVAAASPHTFGLLIPDLGQGEIFEPICEGMARAGTLSHQTLIWGNTSPGNTDKESKALELCLSFIARKVSGVFFAPLELAAHKEEVNRSILSQLDSAHIPTVLLDRGIASYPEPARHDLVGIDNWREGFRMARHLLGTGARRLGFVLQPGSAPTVDARIAGLAEALRQAQLPFPQDAIFCGDPSSRGPVHAWFDRFRPDGLLCANDFTAGQLMHSLLNAGLLVPHDVRVVGFDDVRYASLLPVPLTTLRQPCQEIGVAAMKCMLARLEDPKMIPWSLFLDCEIIVRESCGARSAQQASR